MDDAGHNETLRRFCREHPPRFDVTPHGHRVPRTAEHNILMREKFAALYGRPPRPDELPRILATVFSETVYGGGGGGAA